MKTITKIVYAALALLALDSFALLQRAQAVLPAPDGEYPGGNTAEGHQALLSLSGGTYNTAVGFISLASNIGGNFNTGLGAAPIVQQPPEKVTTLKNVP